MIEVLTSTLPNFKEKDILGIGTFSFNPFAKKRIGKSEKNSFFLDDIKISVLDEESAKSFLGSAGLGLAGGILLGPVGLIAGALSGGNKKSVVFGILIDNDETKKLIVKTSNKTDITTLKSMSYTF